MHERSLVKALLRQVEDVAAKRPAGRVAKIRVRVGEFSGVEPELLASAYEDIVAGTPFRDAVLDWERVPREGCCDQCNHRFRIERFEFQCDLCGSRKITVLGGEELQLDSITMVEVVP